MSRELERARADVARCKAACTAGWAIEGFHPEHVFFAAHNYHRLVQELRAAEERLRLLELREHPPAANDTKPEVA